MIKTICLGSGFYVPNNRIIHVFPYDTSMGRKLVTSVKNSDSDGTRLYDCSGRRAKSSVVIVEGGSEGVHVILSPLTVKTIVKSRLER